MTDRIYVGTLPDTLANGRPLDPGARDDVIKLTAEQESEPHNAALIERGLLIPKPTPKAKKQEDAA